jgi:hypothetical protein
MLTVGRNWCGFFCILIHTYECSDSPPPIEGQCVYPNGISFKHSIVKLKQLAFHSLQDHFILSNKFIVFVQRGGMLF